MGMAVSIVATELVSILSIGIHFSIDIVSTLSYGNDTDNPRVQTKLN